MIKPSKVVKLTNLINDCVIMIQQAGQLVQQTNSMSSAFATARAQAAGKSINRGQNIADLDLLIR